MYLSCSFATGVEFRESTLSITAKNTAVAKKGKILIFA